MKVLKQVFSSFLALCLMISMLPVSGIGSADTVYAAENGKLVNGALTSNADGWTIEGVGSDAYNFDSGYLSIWIEEGDYDFSLTQTITNVAEGSYYAKAPIVGNGNQGASTSRDTLSLSVKNNTANTEETVPLTTDGWDNWDNAPQTNAIAVAEGDSVTITISGALTTGDWYAIKNVVFAEATEAVEAPINVQKVEGLSEDFVHGVDVSSYLSLVQSGAKYYDENGQEADLFDIMENAGINYVRLRVWNSPYPLDDEGNQIFVEEDGTTEHSATEVTKTETNVKGYKEYYLADGTQVYLETYGGGVCDVDTAVAIGKIATAHNMKVLIDFHYSDFWADPNKKSVPKTWENMTLEEKTVALKEFTEESLNTLLDAGVDVGMVQIGNEINNGMAGQKDNQDVYTLLKAGSEAVRSVSKDILIAVHFTNPHNEGYQIGRAAELDAAGVDYDAFGTSYYPYWHGSAETLYEDLKEIADTYNKKVYVAEISYPWTLEDGDGFGNNASEYSTDMDFTYEIGPEGQATAVRNAIAAVSQIGENGLGTFWWEPAWIPVNYAYNEDGSLNNEAWLANQKAWKLFGSGWASIYASEYDPEVTSDINGGSWDNQGFFDFQGHVLDSINVYKWVYTGAVGPTKVSTVDAASCEMIYQTTPSLPETVKVNLNDGTSLDVSVTWNAEQVEKLKTADYGEYTIKGSVDAFSYESRGEKVNVAAGEHEATCSVVITGTVNYVTNGDFETGDETGWTLTNTAGTGNPAIGTNSGDAKNGSHYYTAWDEVPIDFSIDQTITTNPPAGLYTLFAYYQGTGVKEVTSDSSLYAIVTYKDGTKKTYSGAVEIHNVWKDFYQAKVNNIIINDNVTSITVGTRLSCTPTDLGAWVVVDDISLMKAGELSAADAAVGAVVSSGDNTNTGSNVSTGTGSNTTVKTYTLKYNVNGGKKLAATSKKVTYGKTYGKLATPKRVGYTFSGWYTAKTGGKKITATSKVTITKNTTVYAHWKKVTAPAKVKKVTAKNSSSKKAKVTFKKVSKADGYEIRYSTKKNMKGAKKVTTTKTSKTISKLKKGKTYYIQVRAYKLDSAGKKVYSKKYSTKVTVKIKK